MKTPSSLLDTDVLPEHLKKRCDTLTAYASTVFANARSTIEPPAQTLSTIPALEVALSRLDGSAEQTPGILLGEKLGEGGMGVVHAAIQLSLDRSVAVKSLRDPSQSGERERELLREAWTMSSLEHPNIVPVYDVGYDTSRGPLVILKRIEGVSWGSLMHNREAITTRFRVRDALSWNLRVLIQVCNSIAFAHSRGVVHRDIKPDNVMVGPFGEVYVLDWGLAVTVREGDTRLPLARLATQMAGTPGYMAPEMLGGECEGISERTDVYLLGATLYEIFEGHAPHAAPTLHAMIASILMSAPKFSAETPAEGIEMCRRAMAPESTARFESVVAFRTALETFLEHQGSRELAQTAIEHAERLDRLIAEGAPQVDVSRVFGECRFGFRAALATWPDNAVAMSGLRQAVSAMAQCYLNAKDPNGALAVLQELPEDLSDLRHRAERIAREHADTHASLVNLGKQIDLGKGSRTRAAGVLVLSLPWVILPITAWVIQDRLEVAHVLAAYATLYCLAIPFGIWRRASLTATGINRRMLANLVAILSLQGLIVVLAATAGMPLPATLLILLVSAVGAGNSLAMLIDRRLWPVVPAGVVAVTLGTLSPRHLFLAIALSNAAAVGSMVASWAGGSPKSAPTDSP